jgi:hypothetical protein
VRIAGIVVLAAVATGAFAQQYRWTDDKGRVQYTDTPPPASAKGVQRKNFGGGPAGKAEQDPLSAALQAAVKNFRSGFTRSPTAPSAAPRRAVT